VKVAVEVPDPGAAIDVGLKPTVTPAGAPLDDNATAELKPFIVVVVMVEVPADPCATVTAVGEAAMVKSGGGGLPDNCVTPMYATGVYSDLPMLDPTLTRSLVPLRVTCRTTLLEDHCAAVRTPPVASTNVFALMVAALTENSGVVPSRN